ncbi:unnamed protein product [Rhizophagus irregularis]|nr:unnamed protein product [Rhizophagus irregularis]
MSEKEGIKIDSHELRDNLVNFFIAGHDSNHSLNISVAIYHLAKYPEMQKKARDEVIRVLGNELNIPTPEQLKELKYINAVIKNHYVHILH